MAGSPGKFAKEFKTIQEIANYAQLYGEREEVWFVQKFGENQDIDSGVTEDIWAYGGDRPKPGAAELFNITSSNANDTAAGTGTRLVLIQGLDANYDFQEEYISMNGTSNVSTANTYINIHRMLSGLVGSTEANQGTITATGADSSNVMASIPTGYNITQMTHFMVPRGYTGYITNLDIAAYKADGSGSRKAEISLWIQIPGFAEFRVQVYGVTDNVINVPFTAGTVVTEKSLIWMEAKAAVNNTSVSGQYEIVMIKDDWVRTP